jgi:hypothetical protein
LTAVGCGASPPGTASGSPGATPPGPSPAASTATPSPPATPGPEPSPTLPAIVDPSLLAILPGEVAGSAVNEDVDGEREFAVDPGATVRRYAAAVVGDAGENIASASIAAVDPADMAAFFPAWRADYDEAACAATGGVDDASMAEIGGREAEMTTCVSGIRIYHVSVRDGSLILSITSIGPVDYGAKLIEGLRE